MSRAVHWNNNIVCVMDCETTGLDSSENDIWNFCCLPLDSWYKPREDVLPFDVMIKPRFPENVQLEAIRMHPNEYRQACIQGLEHGRAGDWFIEWFERLRLPPRHRILPMAHNWPFDREFIREWLGKANFEHMIDSRYRDTMAIASHINDRCDFRNEPAMFPSLKLGSVCTRLEIDLGRPHLALDDCVATAAVYRKMIKLV